MLDVLLKRRSIRLYTEENLSDSQLNTLLQAAQAAPSANDSRPWELIVVRDARLRQVLAETHPWSGMCASAPIVIVVAGDPRASRHWIEDCSAATQNLLLAVTALDLGAVWVAVHPEGAREAHVRTALHIPDQLRILCLVPVGHPAESKTPRNRDEPDKIHYDFYGRHA